MFYSWNLLLGQTGGSGEKHLFAWTPPSLVRKNTVARKVENGVSKVRLYWGAFIPNDGHRISDEEIGLHQKYFSKIIGLHQYNILQSHWTSTIIFFKNHLLWDSGVKTLLQ